MERRVRQVDFWLGVIRYISLRRSWHRVWIVAEGRSDADVGISAYGYVCVVVVVVVGSVVSIILEGVVVARL